MMMGEGDDEGVAGAGAACGMEKGVGAEFLSSNRPNRFFNDEILNKATKPQMLPHKARIYMSINRKYSPIEVGRIYQR